MSKRFLSGDEAFAEAVRLARPQLISAYPITPQTIVVERLAQMEADGELEGCEYVHVESEHSAMCCAMGASAVGVRTFTATSSQGLLYMAECLPYAAGGRFPIVMMNANRSTALPWSIYGDQRDSLSQLDSGWIQAYAEDAQESLDLALMSFYIAEHPSVSTPFMVNLDGFVLTHTYEAVDVPDRELADVFLPPLETENRVDFEQARNLAFSAGPEHNAVFKYKEHEALLAVKEIVREAEEKFQRIFGRQYSGMVETYNLEDADYAIITLGSISGMVRDLCDSYREQGVAIGVLRLRYIRPFPHEELYSALKNVKAAAVLEKDISFGNAGTVYTNVCASLFQSGLALPVSNFVAGLGGKNVSAKKIDVIVKAVQAGERGVTFLDVEESYNG